MIMKYSLHTPYTGLVVGYLRQVTVFYEPGFRFTIKKRVLGMGSPTHNDVYISFLLIFEENLTVASSHQK